MRDPSAQARSAWPVCRRSAPVAIAVALLLGSAGSSAQQRGLSITPTFSASLELTDNRDLSATDRRAELITTLSPGIRLASRTGRVRGSLDYSLDAIIYARDSSDNTLQNRLAAALDAELIEQHAFFDARASISRQYVSAFGSQADRPNEINDNSTERRWISLSPSLRGRLFGEVDVQARLTSSYSSSADYSASDSANHDASLSLADELGAFGWSLTATRTISDFQGGRRTEEDRLLARISYAFDVGLSAFVTFGRERNDVLSLEKRSYDNWGGGIVWRPSPRTSLSLQGERRYHGNTHAVSFSHRVRRAVVSYSDSRSVSDSTAGVEATLSVYQLYFSLFASLEPDPALRDLLVRNYLQAAGLDPDERLTAGFLNTALTERSSRDLSLALQGRRYNLVVSAFASTSRRTDTISQGQDDLAQADRVRQYGLTASLSHRLSPNSSVVMASSWRRTDASGGFGGTSLSSLSVSWSNRLSERTSVSLTGRHARATGNNEYHESSVLAVYRQTF